MRNTNQWIASNLIDKIQELVELELSLNKSQFSGKNWDWRRGSLELSKILIVEQLKQLK